MYGDFTRLTFDNTRHYRNVRRQQGRVDVDADWNEQSDITSHRIEIEAKDVIGACGVPRHDAGFAILDPASLPAPQPVLKPGDFLISAGRAYVNGILCVNESVVSYSAQPDRRAPPLDAAGRYIVYLDVWLRHIMALDDAAIRETALGGPDTATRVKTVWQLRALQAGDLGAAIGCKDDPRQWLDATAASTAKLSARAAKEAKSDKPCILPPGAGYRRLENQLYRVEIHRGGAVDDADKAKVATWKWSRDNGSVVAGIQRMSAGKITITAARQDAALGFAPGQWIEVLDDRNEWERVPGVLVPILAVEDLTLTLDVSQAIEPGPNALTNFAAALDAAFHPKVRRWDSAGVIPATIPASNDGFVPLEDGVESRFVAGTCKTGDYWLIPARTNTGNVEWPADPVAPGNPLDCAPRGVTHQYCRVAVIEVDKAGKVTLIEDCRRLFSPLTEIDSGSCCCNVTVGESSSADFRTIQEAVDSLPVTGGRICVLEGTYSRPTRIAGRSNITISGCRGRSRLIGERGVRDKIAALILIEKSSNIRIESLVFTLGSECAVAALASTQLSVIDCDIQMTDARSSAPGLYLQVQSGSVERSRIVGIEIAKMLDNAALASDGRGASGIQIAGGSRDIHIVENLIGGMSGQGIMLGSLEDTNVDGGDRTPIVGRPWDNSDPCGDRLPLTTLILSRYIHFVLRVPRLRHAADPVQNVCIERNRILATGLDGIGVAGFFDLREADEFISVRRLQILDNQIVGCLRSAAPPIEPAMKDSMGYGGIALADVSDLEVRDNVIEQNGANNPQPVCGIFILHGEGVEISGNRILANGGRPRVLPTKLLLGKVGSGRLGGIQIVFAVAPVAVSADTVQNIAAFAAVQVRVPEPAGPAALDVHHNIVHSPVGSALFATALGPVSVSDNHLSSGAVIDPGHPSVLAPGVAFVFNLGVSNEAYAQQILFASTASAPKITSGMDDLRIGGRLVNGNIIFANNQCSLDLLEAGRSGAFASLTLASLDDVAVQNNQSDCNLGLRDDFMVTNAFVMAASTRVSGNRFKEGLFQSAYSAMTTAILNTTNGNQSTHCLSVKGPNALLNSAPNTVLVNAMPGHQCEQRLLGALLQLAAYRKVSP
jgi:hypothetical protein